MNKSSINEIINNNQVIEFDYCNENFYINKNSQNCITLTNKKDRLISVNNVDTLLNMRIDDVEIAYILNILPSYAISII